MNKEMEKIVIAAVLAFALGAAGGYLFASKKIQPDNKVEGTCSLEEGGLGSGTATSAVEEVKKKINPYTRIEEKANPFKDVYVNPFAQ